MSALEISQFCVFAGHIVRLAAASLNKPTKKHNLENYMGFQTEQLYLLF